MYSSSAEEIKFEGCFPVRGGQPRSLATNFTPPSEPPFDRPLLPPPELLGRARSAAAPTYADRSRARTIHTPVSRVNGLRGLRDIRDLAKTVKSKKGGRTQPVSLLRLAYNADDI